MKTGRYNLHGRMLTAIFFLFAVFGSIVHTPPGIAGDLLPFAGQITEECEGAEEHGVQRKYRIALSEGDNTLRKWFDVYGEQSQSLYKKFNLLIWIIVPLLVLAIAGFFWSWTLKRQVRLRITEFDNELLERKRAEDALRTTNDLLSLFIKHSPIYAFIKEVSPTVSRVATASPLSMSSWKSKPLTARERPY